MDVREFRVYCGGAGIHPEASAGRTAVATMVPLAEGLVVFGTPIGDPAWDQLHLEALKNPQVS